MTTSQTVFIHGSRMPSKKLTILFTPVDAMGHFNASMGVAAPLRDRGHKVIFAVPPGMRNKLTAQGFEEEPYFNGTQGLNASQTTWRDMVQRMVPNLELEAPDQFRPFLGALYKEVSAQCQESHAGLLEIVARTQPDIIVADYTIQEPAIMNAGSELSSIHSDIECANPKSTVRSCDIQPFNLF
jgi:UDP:flavonoid glycosyltransferase YjiC (YdhE family)